MAGELEMWYKMILGFVRSSQSLVELSQVSTSSMKKQKVNEEMVQVQATSVGNKQTLGNLVHIHDGVSMEEAHSGGVFGHD